ncbi:MAG TPA: patatin family protein [Flavobacteriales bacterium]|nr:patatin family protein [Flavobacteriales bacterium]
MHAPPPDTFLILQGGGFRTAFTAGVLDAFIAARHHPFTGYLGVSGGSIALSYFLSQQYGQCYKAMRVMAADPEFVKMSRAMSESGYMDIDRLQRVALKTVPFDLHRALDHVHEKHLEFVLTDRTTGEAAYLCPSASDWVDTVIGSSTLPGVTKGRHNLAGREYFDGGWSDPLPAQRAIDLGAKHIVVLRTAPAAVRLKQSWPDYFGSLYFRKHPALAQCFANSHQVYNASLDLMERPPIGVEIQQIAPEHVLRSGTYSYSAASLELDYRHGLDAGLRFVHEQRTADNTLAEGPSSVRAVQVM